MSAAAAEEGTEGEGIVLPNETLAQYVKAMIELHTLIKEKNKDVKKLKTEYNKMSTAVKGHMRKQELMYVDMAGHQVHTYSRTREPTMNQTFIAEQLSDFFATGKYKTMSADRLSVAVAEYLQDRKKEKVGGKKVWTTTLRNISAKRAKAKAKRGSKRKHGTPAFVDDEEEDAADVVEHVPLPACLQSDDGEADDVPAAKRRRRSSSRVIL